MRNIYLLCDWNKSNDSQYIPLCNLLRTKHEGNVIALTFKDKYENTALSEAFDRVYRFDSIFSLTRFIRKQPDNKFYFVYNHKELSSKEIKILLSIKLSLKKNIIYIPKSLYYLEKSLLNSYISDELKKSLGNYYFRSYFRKVEINTKIFFVFVLFLPYFYFKKKFKIKKNKKNDNFKKILFIRVDRFGDMVLSFPALVALRKKYPESEIHVLCSPMNSFFIEDQNSLQKIIDKIIVWDDIWDMHGDIVPGLFHFIKLVKFSLKLRKYKYDLIIQPIPLSVWLILALILKSDFVISTINEELKLGFLLRKFVDISCIIKKGKKIHYFKQVNNCLYVLGIKDINKDVLKVDKTKIKKEIVDITNLTEKKIIINLSAGDKVRKLSKNQLFGLINSLKKELNEIKFKIVLIGTKEDVKVAKKLKDTYNSSILDFVGKTSINELIYIFKNSEILITPDTGTMHLASLTNISIIALFGAGDPDLFSPISENSTIIKHELGCSGCGDICFETTLPPPCIKAISIDEIIDAVKKHLL